MDRTENDLLESRMLEGIDALLSGVLASQAVKTALKDSGDWGDEKRWRVAQAIYGVRVWWRRLVAVLGDDTADSARLLAAWRSEMAALDAPRDWGGDPVAALGCEWSMPDFIADHFFTLLGGDGAAALFRVFNEPGPITIRINPMRGSRDEIAAALLAEGIAADEHPASPWALNLPRGTNVWGSALWRDGLFEVQDAGSQRIALALDAQPGERVVDFCAGRGGKTLALAAAMEDRGDLLALDVDEKALSTLKGRVGRLGLKCVSRATLNPEGQSEALFPWKGKADRVLVDAPCSQLGILRRHPDLRWQLEPAALSQYPEQQREILGHAAPWVRPGGLLVYATCTLNPRENEEVVEDFLSHAPFTRAPGPAKKEETLWPHESGTDGFYIARLQRI
jgi:16S rRNA (cytosine967-C5)-methyltransferase